MLITTFAIHFLFSSCRPGFWLLMALLCLIRNGSWRNVSIKQGPTPHSPISHPAPCPRPNCPPRFVWLCTALHTYYTLHNNILHTNALDGLNQVDPSDQGNSLKNQSVGLLQAVSYLKGSLLLFYGVRAYFLLYAPFSPDRYSFFL